MSVRCALLILAVGLLPLTSGCAGKRIRAAYAERQSHPVEVTRPAAAGRTAPDGAPHYHLAFRASPALLDRFLTALLSRNLIEAAQERAGRRQEAGEGEAAGGEEPGEEARPPRRGPRSGPRPGAPFPGPRGGGGEGAFPGPLGQQLAERLSDKLGGGRLALGNLSPDLHAESVTVGFLPECEGCLRLQLALQGGLSAPEMRRIGLGGEVILKAKLEPVTQEGGPAIAVRLEEVEKLHIELPISLPGPFSQLQSRLEDALRDRVTAMLKEGDRDITQVVPLADRLKLGPGVALEGIGLRTAPSPQGELFLGLDTNLTAKPAVTFEGRGGRLTGADWSILVSEEVVGQLVHQAALSGKMPTRFNRRGEPDPEGPVAFDLERVRFTPTGFELDVRLWYFSFPAWWRDYTLEGTLAIQDGQLRPRITRMTPGAGDGATWVSRFVEKRVTSNRAVKGMGRTLPETMPLPMSEDRAARLTPTGVQPSPGVLAISGTFEVVEVAPEGGPASPEGAEATGQGGGR